MVSSLITLGFLSHIQHLLEGTEGTASFDELQGAELSHFERKVPGISTLRMHF